MGHKPVNAQKGKQGFQRTGTTPPPAPTPADPASRNDGDAFGQQSPAPDYAAMHTALTGHADNPPPKLVARRSKNGITIHAAGCTHVQTEILGSMSEVTPESFQAMANEVDPDADYDAASCAKKLAMNDPDGDFAGWMKFLRLHSRWRNEWTEETT